MLTTIFSSRVYYHHFYLFKNTMAKVSRVLSLDNLVLKYHRARRDRRISRAISWGRDRSNPCDHRDKERKVTILQSLSGDL